MKRIIVIIFSAFIAGAALKSCGLDTASQEPKSSECDILEFRDDVNSVEWDINGTNITATYPAGSDLSSITPTIIVSEKATTSLKSGEEIDFSNLKEAICTVTAENGTVKVYQAQATAETPCHCIMDTLKGEWSWVKKIGGFFGENIDNQYKSVLNILSQNEDGTINYEVFKDDILFYRGSFQYQYIWWAGIRVDIVLPHYPLSFWYIVPTGTGEWPKDTLIFWMGAMDGYEFYYQKIKK